ncbi:MAG: aminotransferase class I/II-fold pyridoxal phosphate-dependent enzyme [Neomegalonema sp.]|nr:aminotransferase class I/II-fold pyridoxal phosphate-dependent enzyme [Neomegalonema sp.]
MKISRRVASQRSDVAPFEAMETMREAAALEAAGRDIAHLEVGQPGEPAPKAALEAVRSALRDPLGYTVALGLAPLREGVADLYRARHGLVIDPSRIVATTGSSAGFQLAFIAAFNPGARIAMAEPGYPSYRQIASALGLTPVGLPVGPENRWTPTAAMLDAAAAEAPIDGVLIASPANPTGVAATRSELAALTGWCATNGAWFISDEIYHGLTYDEPAASALEFDNDAIIVSSFSKYFAMTGWRIGWMVLPEPLLRPIERLAQNLFICPPHVSQIAALAALSAEAALELEARREVYAANRDYLMRMLPELKLGGAAPCDGAFYLYFQLPDGAPNSKEWCAKLLHEAGVATTPGLDFDPRRGERTARISFAGSPEEVRKGAERIAAWAAKQDY